MTERIIEYFTDEHQSFQKDNGELIRCKNCIKQYDDSNNGCPYCNECGGREFPPDNWFCADGIRRDE